MAKESRIPNAGQVLQMLLLGVIILFAIGQLVNFSAISTGDTSNIFTPITDYGDFISNIFLYVFLAILTFLIYRQVMLVGRAPTKNDLLYLALVGAGIYFVYTLFLAPQFGWPTLEFALVGLQNMAFVP